MGLSLCKPCCRCCRCCREEVPPEMPPPPNHKEANKMGFYRSHDMNFPSDLNDGAFTPSDEAPPSGGPGPEPPNDGHSAAQLAVPIYTAAPGKRRSYQLEALRTQVSTHNFKPRSAEELEVHKGEEVVVLEDRGTWIYAKTRNAAGESQTGFVPRTFLANAGSLEAEEHR